MVDPIRSVMSKTVKGIQFKYSSFVNQINALNVSTTEEGLSFRFKDHIIVIGLYHKSNSIQVKVKISQRKDWY